MYVWGKEYFSPHHIPQTTYSAEYDKTRVIMPYILICGDVVYVGVINNLYIYIDICIK